MHATTTPWTRPLRALFSGLVFGIVLSATLAGCGVAPAEDQPQVAQAAVAQALTDPTAPAASRGVERLACKRSYDNCLLGCGSDTSCRLWCKDSYNECLSLCAGQPQCRTFDSPTARPTEGGADQLCRRAFCTPYYCCYTCSPSGLLTCE